MIYKISPGIVIGYGILGGFLFSIAVFLGIFIAIKLTPKQMEDPRMKKKSSVRPPDYSLE